MGALSDSRRFFLVEGDPGEYETCRYVAWVFGSEAEAKEACEFANALASHIEDVLWERYEAAKGDAANTAAWERIERFGARAQRRMGDDSWQPGTRYYVQSLRITGRPGSWKREKDHRIMTQQNFGKRIRLEAAPTATDQAQEDPKP
ncbi:MAG: hypothetical protein AB7Q16_05875 [Vicinamibacterales bacterium]